MRLVASFFFGSLDNFPWHVAIVMADLSDLTDSARADKAKGIARADLAIDHAENRQGKGKGKGGKGKEGKCSAERWDKRDRKHFYKHQQQQGQRDHQCSMDT